MPMAWLRRLAMAWAAVAVRAWEASSSLSRYRDNADNGSAFASKQLERACAVLGIRLIHSRPGQPAEARSSARFAPCASSSWSNWRPAPRAARIWPSSTACSKPGSRASTTAARIRRPASRPWNASSPASRTGRRSCPLPPSCATRPVVGETAGDQDRRGLPARQPLRRGPALVGASVELVFDPFDLTRIEVRYQGRAMGAAAPPRTPTGIDYLGLVEQRLAAEGRQRISYALLADQPKPPRRSDQRGGQAE